MKLIYTVIHMATQIPYTRQEILVLKGCEKVEINLPECMYIYVSKSGKRGNNRRNQKKNSRNKRNKTKNKTPNSEGKLHRAENR